jgi:hypothetical protein
VGGDTNTAGLAMDARQAMGGASVQATISSPPGQTLCCRAYPVRTSTLSLLVVPQQDRALL